MSCNQYHSLTQSVTQECNFILEFFSFTGFNLKYHVYLYLRIVIVLDCNLICLFAHRSICIFFCYHLPVCPPFYLYFFCYYLSVCLIKDFHFKWILMLLGQLEWHDILKLRCFNHFEIIRNFTYIIAPYKCTSS